MPAGGGSCEMGIIVGGVGLGWPKTGVRLTMSNPSARYFEIFIGTV
jgi:hypothetical protein